MKIGEPECIIGERGVRDVYIEGGRVARERPSITQLMYVRGGDRSLSHELLIVRRHNSPASSLWRARTKVRVDVCPVLLHRRIQDNQLYVIYSITLYI